VIVSTLPLLTELDPNARVSTLALAIAFLTVGRAVGTLAGAVGYARWGMTVVGVAAALTLLASLGAFTRLVTEPRPA
jgi:predicted MFS family arabinose efflux permease